MLDQAKCGLLRAMSTVAHDPSVMIGKVVISETNRQTNSIAVTVMTNIRLVRRGDFRHDGLVVAVFVLRLMVVQQLYCYSCGCVILLLWCS